MSALQSRFKKLLMLAGYLLIACIAIGPLASTAEAAIRGCRSDPIIVLSDGTILDVTAEIGTDVANVREIHYALHGPAGVWPVLVISTPTLGFTGKETFTYIADAKPRTYTTATLVRTSINQVPVTSYTTFAKATIFGYTAVTVAFNPVQGFNNQTLRYTIQH
jgi:hypothetical protein